MANPLTKTLAFYAEHAEEFDRKTRSIDLSELYEKFTRNLPPGSFVLDAGCGTGRDALAFQQRGFRIDAIDASPQLVEIARRHGANARVSTFRRLRARAKYQGIWACASLLHVPHAEIPIVLRNFARALVDNGVLYVSLKQGTGESFTPDGRFFSLFSLQEFSHFLEQEKLFSVKHAWTNRSPDSAGKPITWLNFLALKRPKPRARSGS